jgi:hypothetical protein
MFKNLQRKVNKHVNLAQEIKIIWRFHEVTLSSLQKCAYNISNRNNLRHQGSPHSEPN